MAVTRHGPFHGRGIEGGPCQSHLFGGRNPLSRSPKWWRRSDLESTARRMRIWAARVRSDGPGWHRPRLVKEMSGASIVGLARGAFGLRRRPTALLTGSRNRSALSDICNRRRLGLRFTGLLNPRLNARFRAEPTAASGHTPASTNPACGLAMTSWYYFGGRVSGSSDRPQSDERTVQAGGQGPNMPKSCEC